MTFYQDKYTNRNILKEHNLVNLNRDFITKSSIIRVTIIIITSLADFLLKLNQA
jgi:hypothetical protein